MQLQKIRKEIDQLDDQLLTLLNQRAEQVLHVAEIKKKEGSPIYVPQREKALMQSLHVKNKGPLSADAVAHIYQTILQEMRLLQDG